MKLPIAPANIIFELICFAAFAAICGGLLKPRFSVKTSLLITTGCMAVVAGLQTAVFLESDGSLQMVLTMLPATAYLPAIITVHVLSKNGFATAVATWSFGLLMPYILNLLRNLLFAVSRSMTFDWLNLAVLCSLVLAAFLVFTVMRFCREPFQQYVFRNKYIWIIIPVILAFSLASYVENINFTPILAGILFLSLLTMFLFIIKFFNVAMSEQISRASEQTIAAQLELQREDIARVRQKVEQGRIYRHDMHHHLSVLKELAERESADSVRRYIGELNNQLSSAEKEDYCENATVNAVLGSYIGRAKQQGISVTVKARIPQKLPVDEIDICTIMANGLDNAIAACRENKSDRWIELNSGLHGNGNFSIDIRNACDTNIEFGKDGMPISYKGEGHGFGLKSIKAVVQKYNGLLSCTCDNRVFRLSIALFQSDSNMTAKSFTGMRRAASNTVVTFLLLLCFINIFPHTAQALESVPVIGNVLRMVNFRTYHSSFNWGSSSLAISFPQIEWEESVSGLLQSATENNEYTAKSYEPAVSETESSGNNTKPQASELTIPKAPPLTELIVEGETSEPLIPDASEPVLPPENIPDISDGVEDMNQQMEAYIQTVEKEFLWYFLQKYQGYVASETGYNILRNDERLLSVCFYTTINAGGSGEYSRCFTLDKTTGKVLTLSDLFTEGSDYTGVISSDILRQMAEQSEAGEGEYFLPGGIWSPEECFKEIEPNQNFYIEENNKLVIIFDEYEVAPGSMGMPKFIVETAVLNDILYRPSLLSVTGKEET